MNIQMIDSILQELATPSKSFRAESKTVELRKMASMTFKLGKLFKLLSWQLNLRRGMDRYDMKWEFLTSSQLEWKFNEKPTDIVSFEWEIFRSHSIRMEKNTDIISFEWDFSVFFYEISIEGFKKIFSTFDSYKF